MHRFVPLFVQIQLVFFFYCYGDLIDLHSFPTRRSSDLCAMPGCCNRPSACDTSSKRRSSSDRKSTRLNSSHTVISYAVFCLKKKKKVVQDTIIRSSPWKSKRPRRVETV